MITKMKIDLKFKYKDLLEYIHKEKPFNPEFTIILGSGLGDFATSVKVIKSISTEDLPGYPPSTVAGHAGQIIFSETENKKLLLFKGRIHFYEGYKIYECILPVFITHQMNCNRILLTNAAGGINRNYSPGDLMLADSFNGINIKKELAGLIDLPSGEIKNKFIDFPSSQLNDVVRKAAIEEGISLQTGTYWYSKGPGYETPSEINMMFKFGGDAVGMSTVHEAVYASSIGMEVISISCITNFAAGISSSKLSHVEVTETASGVKSKFERLVRRIISSI
jgi:purine-nucleoside phosphorylase